MALIEVKPESVVGGCGTEGLGGVWVTTLCVGATGSVAFSFVYSSLLLLPRGAGSICGKEGALVSTGVLL